MATPLTYQNSHPMCYHSFGRIAPVILLAYDILEITCYHYIYALLYFHRTSQLALMVCCGISKGSGIARISQVSTNMRRECNALKLCISQKACKQQHFPHHSMSWWQILYGECLLCYCSRHIQMYGPVCIWQAVSIYLNILSVLI